MDHKFIHPIETRYRTEMAKYFTEEKKKREVMFNQIFWNEKAAYVIPATLIRQIAAVNAPEIG